MIILRGNNMQICLVHEEYPEETNFGGIATYQKRVAEEYVRQGHIVYVIARSLKKDREYVENGVNIKRIYVGHTKNQTDNYVNYRKKVAKELKKLQNEHKIDIIEVPDWGAETIMFEKFRRVPLVVRLHTPLKIWLCYNKNNFGKVRELLLEWEKTMLYKADFITCCSHILRDLVVKEFNINSDKIFVSPNPADIITFFPNKTINKENRILYVGSLEERKGVCVLAKALNIVFKNLPQVKVDFVGKDTNRNKKNISTEEYIKKIIKNKYHNNIKFLGQKENIELNFFYNRSRVAVFPSLFDNFPYVVLEAMATGVRIVGSRNSGMTEMLSHEYIYDTPSYRDLAKLIIEQYYKSEIEPYDLDNIKKVNNEFNSQIVCKHMLEIYKKIISEFYERKILLKNIKKILCKCGIRDNILSIKREEQGVANIVYKVDMQKGCYIIKKYNRMIDNKMTSLLYQLYDSIGFIPVMPINDNPITIKGIQYNVFNYINGKHLSVKKAKKILPLIKLNRKCLAQNNNLIKVNFYYDKLKNFIKNKKNSQIEFVLDQYEEIKNELILKESFVNHGDLSEGNIIIKGNKIYIIDFDETTIAPMLYDFAVVSVKYFMKNGVNNVDNSYYELRDELIKETQYNVADSLIVIKYYLCKILLEKFYLHIKKEIDIFSEDQKKDNYLNYLILLKNL